MLPPYAKCTAKNTTDLKRIGDSEKERTIGTIKWNTLQGIIYFPWYHNNNSMDPDFFLPPFRVSLPLLFLLLWPIYIVYAKYSYKRRPVYMCRRKTRPEEAAPCALPSTNDGVDGVTGSK